MVYKSKIGLSLWVMVAILSVTIAALILLVIFLELYSWAAWLCAIIAVGLAAVMIFHLLPRVKDTYYVISDIDLLIKTGRHEIRIPFSNIIDISRGVKSMDMQPALSFIRVEIKYRTPGGMTDVVHVSPVNEDEFVNMLNGGEL